MSIYINRFNPYLKGLLTENQGHSPMMELLAIEPAFFNNFKQRIEQTNAYEKIDLTLTHSCCDACMLTD
ncbi:MAG: hypothetical protein Tsb0034_29980 [Ekhidna sp.]